MTAEVFDQAAAVAAVGALEPDAISAILRSLSARIAANPEYLASSNSDLFEAIVGAMNSCDRTKPILTSLFDITTVVLSGLTDEQKTEFTDAGFGFFVSDLLASDDVELLAIVCDFISKVTQQSDYACDAFFTLDFHNLLIGIAKRAEGEELQVAASNALFRLYGDHASILSTILRDSLPLLLELLELSSKKARACVVKALIEVTNQRCSLSPELIEPGHVRQIMGMIDDEELTGSVLPLIGNLCLSSRDHLEIMFELGLPKKLLKLTKNDAYAADAFWALSNLIECAPDVFSSHEISEDKLHSFISLVIEKARGESPQLKKEAVFFLASLIMFSSRRYLIMFMRKDVFDLIVKVLMVAQDDAIKNRFLDVFNRFCIHVQHNEETFAKFKALTHECGIMDQFEQIKSHEESFFAQKIQNIEENLAQLEAEHGTAQ